MKVQEDQLVVSKDHTHIMIKGKRTKRQRLPSPLSLAMHSSTSCSSNGGRSSTENSPTNSNIDYNRTQEEEDMANCLILLAQGKSNNNKSSSGLRLYECKTCNRCFPSFQALGGHRASHKKPKANTIFMNQEDDHYDPTTTTSTFLSLQISNNNRPFPLHRSSHTTSTTNATTKLSKVHECSICGAEFSSGQALGGHMRRHRTNSVSTYTASATTTTTTSMNSGNIIGGGSLESQEAKKPRNVLKLDLNLPAPDDDHRESKFSFQTKENVIVFSAPSLVDCHY